MGATVAPEILKDLKKGLHAVGHAFARWARALSMTVDDVLSRHQLSVAAGCTAAIRAFLCVSFRAPGGVSRRVHLPQDARSRRTMGLMPFPGGETTRARGAIDVFGGNPTSALCETPWAPHAADATCFLTHWLISTLAVLCWPSRRHALRPRSVSKADDRPVPRDLPHRYGSRRRLSGRQAATHELYLRGPLIGCASAAGGGGRRDGALVRGSHRLRDAACASSTKHDYDDPIADLARFTGFCPGHERAAPHPARRQEGGVSLLDILPTLSLPRTPWSTREGTAAVAEHAGAAVAEIIKGRVLGID